MTKRRLLRWSLILLTFAAFAVWLESTRVVWGWLRGEAFYQGRPTSYWRQEFPNWQTKLQSRVFAVNAADGSPKEEMHTKLSLLRNAHAPKGFARWFLENVLRRDDIEPTQEVDVEDARRL